MKIAYGLYMFLLMSLARAQSESDFSNEDEHDMREVLDVNTPGKKFFSSVSENLIYTFIARL